MELWAPAELVLESAEVLVQLLFAPSGVQGWVSVVLTELIRVQGQIPSL